MVDVICLEKHAKHTHIISVTILYYAVLTLTTLDDFLVNTNVIKCNKTENIYYILKKHCMPVLIIYTMTWEYVFC